MHACDGTRPFCFRFRSTRVAHGDARDGTDGIDRVVVDDGVDDGVVAGRVVAMRRARGAKGVFRARMGTGRGDAENARGGDEDARGDGVNAVEAAVRALGRGGVIAVPTDTIMDLRVARRDDERCAAIVPGQGETNGRAGGDRGGRREGRGDVWACAHLDEGMLERILPGP